MNRKLHNTILGFSVAGGMLALGLMAAVPFPSGAGGAAASAQGHPVWAGTDLSPARAEAIEARTRAFEAELERAESPNEMIAVSAIFLAGVVTEAALAAALSRREQDASGERALTGTDTSERKRNALALPYFSFAHGLRSGGGS